MHIESKERIASVPILAVRNYLRRHDSFCLEGLCKGLQLDEAAGKRLLAALQERGWAVPDEKFPAFFEKTQAAQTFCAGSAARPLTRERAKSLLDGAISRAESTNRDPQYAYYVKSIGLFGSMLSDKERPSDVDIAIELEKRYDDGATFERVDLERQKHAPESVDYVTRAYWSQLEIYRILKQRSTGLSIHPWSDLGLVSEGNRKVVFTAGVVKRQ